MKDLTPSEIKDQYTALYQQVQESRQESTELEEGVTLPSVFHNKLKISKAIKAGKKVKITHKFIPAWKNIDLDISKEGIPYVHDFQGSEDIRWDDIKSFKIEESTIKESDEEPLKPLDKDDPTEVWITDYLDRIDPKYKDPKKDKVIKIALGALFGSQKETEFGFPSKKD